MRAALELARSRDQRERQRIAEADRTYGDDGMRGGFGGCVHGPTLRRSPGEVNGLRLWLATTASPSLRGA
jgi:hypothetical protein